MRNMNEMAMMIEDKLTHYGVKGAHVDVCLRRMKYVVRYYYGGLWHTRDIPFEHSDKINYYIESIVRSCERIREI